LVPAASVRCEDDCGPSACCLRQTQDDVISVILDDIDARTEAILTLNTSLTTTHRQLADGMAAQRSSIESEKYIESYGVLRAFARNVMHFAASDDHDVPKSAFVDKGMATAFVPALSRLETDMSLLFRIAV